MLAERQLGTLPSTTKSNLREHVNTIMLRSSKYIPGPSSVSNNDVDTQVDSSKEVEATKTKDREKEEMHRYAKFLKEILSNKRKFEDLAYVMLNEECSAIFQNKLPEKRHDPGSFTIPCVICNLFLNDALADLGASINVMPYKLFVKLGLGETKPTRMSIQLADRSVKYPKGIVENVLVKVNKFIFPMDFVILDMDGESSVPLILGRPFLVTSRAMIDVCDGKLKLRVGDETLQEVLVEDPLQVTLPRGDEHELSNEEVLELLEFLLANEPSNNTYEFAMIDRIRVQKLRPSLEELLVLDLKELPKRLDYAYMNEDNGLLVIPAADLTPEFNRSICQTRTCRELSPSPAK
ncbi:uncharacterized protein LOC125370275 [Ricinus communis]|uniref:uncharacterized protein LOC125370275 n=1 Tax=Ricinus communis TaxID=3988 RepID=UPI00201ABF9E|nr:uncharacterized protein LOC125370275 [Ricinus communis]